MEYFIHGNISAGDAKKIATGAFFPVAKGRKRLTAGSLGRKGEHAGARFFQAADRRETKIGPTVTKQGAKMRPDYAHGIPRVVLPDV